MAEGLKVMRKLVKRMDELLETKKEEEEHTAKEEETV